MLKVAQVLHFSSQTQKGRDKRILIDEIKKTVVHPNKGGHESALERWLTWLSCARGSTHEKSRDLATTPDGRRSAAGAPVGWFLWFGARLTWKWERRGVWILSGHENDQ